MPVFALDIEGLTLVAALVLILHVDQVQQGPVHRHLVVGWQVRIQLPPANVWNGTEMWNKSN